MKEKSDLKTELRTFSKINYIVILIGFTIFLMSFINASQITSIVLNSTSGTNQSEDNLTSYIFSDIIGNTKKVYDWKLNGTSKNLVNFPFEIGSNPIFTKNYGSGPNASAISANWKSSGGHDGFGAYTMDGSNTNYLTADLGVNQFKANGKYTYSIWIKPTTGNTNNSIVFGDEFSDSFPFFPIFNGFDVYFLDSNTLALWNNYPGRDTFTMGTVSPNNWHQVVLTYDNGIVVSYIDGIKIATSSDVFKDSTGDLTIGWAPDWGAEMEGSIDDFQIWTEVLSAEKISEIYNGRQDLILSSETNLADTWQSCATIFNSSVESSKKCSENLTIIPFGDFIAPTITLTSPTNSTYTTSSIFATISLSEDADWAGYSLDEANNMTLENTTSKNWSSVINGLSNGLHKIIFFANDTSGNMGSTSTVYFTINVDTTDITPPTIILNSPSIIENLQNLKTILNISISETGSISYNLNNKGNITLCSECTQNITLINYSSFGYQNLIIYANDIVGNSASEEFNLTNYLDTDGDGINDTLDFDDDNDGINDTLDFLNGNITNINTNLLEINLSIDGDFNTSQKFIGEKKINITSKGKSFLEFEYNFSKNITLNLAELILLKQKESDTIGKSLVAGLNLSKEKTKTLYIDNLDIDKNTLCIKNAEVNTTDEITLDCTGTDEIKISCDGTNGTFSCTTLNSQYKITGLTHSLVIETFDFPTISAPETPSSSNGGGGGGGNTAPIETCSTEWTCTEWSACEGESQIRTCEKKIESCYAGIEPEKKQNCEIKKEDKGIFEGVELKLDKYVISELNELIALIDFKKLENNLDSVTLSFKILNSNGELIREIEITGKSITKEILVEALAKQIPTGPNYKNILTGKSINSGELEDGTYGLLLTISSGKESVNLFQEFKFKTGKKRTPLMPDIISIISILLLTILWNQSLVRKKHEF